MKDSWGNEIQPILRKDIPVTKYNRSMCCVYGVIDPTGQGRDMVCGVRTRKFWDKDSECWDYMPFCNVHLPIVIAQEKKELEDEQ